MKKIILIVFLTCIFAEYNNPNGKPLTLNISASIFIDNSLGHSIGKVDGNLPINNWLTINGGWFLDKYQQSYIRFDDGVYLSEQMKNHDRFSGGIEIHIPLGSYLGF